MADGNKVFVSPGVYTSEKDLTFVAQSVGVTTLGLVGEALKGPAFEPIFIQSYDDFITRFGGTSPTKYVDSQIPKYELGYIAKSYLSQSNQLFVTRVLGLSGFDAGPSWSIKTLGSLDSSQFSVSTGGTVGNTTTTSAYTAYFDIFVPITGSSGTALGSTVYSDATLTTVLTLPGVLDPSFATSTVTLNNGSTLPTFNNDLISWVKATVTNTTHLYNASCSATTGTCFAYNGGIYQYGCVTTSGTSVATGATSGYTQPVTITNRLDTLCTDYTSYKNDAWYYGLFQYSNSDCCSGGTYSGVSYQLYHGTASADTTNASVGGTAYSGATGQTGPLSLKNSGTTTYSATCAINVEYYSNVPAYDEYDGIVVATLRSRGLSTTGSGGPKYEVTGNTVSFDCTGTYADVLEDPFKPFGVSATTAAGNVYTFKTSMSNTSKDYVSKVFGLSPFDKKKEDVPLFIEEAYPVLLKDIWNKGKVRGLQCCLTYLPSARAATNTNTIAWKMNQWKTPETPWVVSELQGTDVFRLFKSVSISDGTSANREIKISFANLSFERGEFDILVRDFYDSDAAPNVLEKFTRCSMDPTKVSFVGRKVGTSTGEFELKSKYIMLYLGEGVLDGTFVGSLPCGFEGYRFRTYSCSLNPFISYKTKYFTPGETVYDPPFGSGAGNNKVLSGGDKLSKTYLGITNSTGGGYDNDFFDYKSQQPPTAICTGTEGTDWSTITQGFHMDSGATVIRGGVGTYLDWTGTTLNGKSVFQCGVTSFRKEPTLSTDPYKKLRARKWTVIPHGGFDGWDIYRKTRSNTDDYRMGLTGFLNGVCTTTEFPTATGDGSFKKLSSVEANTDYFAYLRAINTFSNPEAVDINVFATPGINYVDNLGLVNETIDMVEDDRADSLYVTTTPDYNMFVKNTTDTLNMVSPEEAVDGIEDSLIDSNYTATYYPWIQVRDTANNKQIFIPPTAEVMRNIALTDNTSFPWFASAGYTRGVVNAVKARKKLTLDERDTLYVGRLNPIATFSDVGPIIWGNKTLQLKESALDRINVRRLLLQTRKLISAVSVRLIFEQNDDIVRQQFLDLVNPILDSIRRDRGLTDFRVVMSSDPEEIDRNEMSGKIYIKPTRALEYIFVEFLVTPTGASFEDI
ncbi:hypothetical protein N9322_00105 [bacterium]|nr:hypothetical protein [bacterium]|tara:strand:+ start:17713 stop:21117 length:3405 start_codon:yes stop_codon:yes gene_type:complete